MNDFETVMMQQCSSNSKMHAKLGGYDQINLGSEDLWPVCTCPAYTESKDGTTIFNHKRVSRYCEHIEKYYSLACSWHELDTDTPQIVEYICPKCGAATESVKVAV